MDPFGALVLILHERNNPECNNHNKQWVLGAIKQVKMLRDYHNWASVSDEFEVLIDSLAHEFDSIKYFEAIEMFYTLVKHEMSQSRSYCSKNLPKYTVDDLHQALGIIDANNGSEDWMYEQMTIIARMRDHFPDFNKVDVDILNKPFRYSAEEAERMMRTLMETSKRGYFENSVYKKFIQCVLFMMEYKSNPIPDNIEMSIDSDDTTEDLDEFDLCNKLSNFNVNEHTL